MAVGRGQLHDRPVRAPHQALGAERRHEMVDERPQVVSPRSAARLGQQARELAEHLRPFRQGGHLGAQASNPSRPLAISGFAP